MKKIVILSDTHIPARARHLPKILLNACEEADLIIHAGDWQTLEVFYELSAYAETVGVAGNVDPWEIVDRFGKKKILTVENLRIGIIHGDGLRKTTEQRAMEAFEHDEVDLIIFGHSHTPLKKETGGVTLFNPGSPTDKRMQQQYSFGILEVGEEWTVKHIHFDKEI
ncbi:metallophosphoesterase family protein [Planococcus salinarum]|uniref:metallophosphoesterase family protein n=1 Tax=Planococcus salinarum TaxID=622695 RepID=UPI000E3C3F49|nr:metallophosphoesterase [Planococcus salinarum]TAA72066.1 metallophosphoesterase [Planococcus salinarum]